MNDHLRIAIADDEPLMQEFLKDALTRLGHEVVTIAKTGRQLVEHCQTLRPDLIITDIKMPELDGLDAAALIYDEGPIPVIIVSAHHDPSLIERAAQNHIFGYLMKPIKDTDLAPAITIAMQRFEEFQTLRKEAEDLRHALEDRKVIERAKGIMMKQAGLDEPSAFRRLQKLARNNSKKLVEIARMIVVTADALEPDDY